MRAKGSLSEADVALLLRRYTASTVLALLQEIACSADSKLNWSLLAKNSNSGISNAKEYQSLWRHLAYRTNISESFEDDALPLEDDSDIEFEVDPVPGVSQEVATNVAACVKVLSRAGTPASNSSKSQEPSFVIDIPNSTSGWEVKGNGQISNVAIQGSQTVEAQPARKKRKLWTSEEDQELIAAVEKCGEGNWATMLKGAFKHERTAAQLSQRWALIRKRRDTQTGLQNITENGTNAVVGSQLPVETSSADGQKVPTSVGPTSGGTEQTCNQSPSTANPTSIAPMAGKNRPPVKRTSITGSSQHRSNSMPPVTTSITNVIQTKSLPTPSSLLPTGNTVSARYITSGMRNAPVNGVGRAPPKSSAGPDPMVQAAAVAAGARIAPASAAASLLKAAQSGNVVHIGIGGVSMGKTVTPNQQNGSNASCNSAKIGATSGSRTPSGASVHYIRTGSTGSPQSLAMVGQRAPQLKGQAIGRSTSSQMTTQGQLTQRPSPISLSQSGHSTSSTFIPQKSQLSNVTSTSLTKAKLTGFPSDACMIVINDNANEGSAKPADCIEGINPVLKTSAQDSNAIGVNLSPLQNSSESSSKCNTADNQASDSNPPLVSGSKAETSVLGVKSVSINKPANAIVGNETSLATPNDSTIASSEKVSE